jgi:hypothetical protein
MKEWVENSNNLKINHNKSEKHSYKLPKLMKCKRKY